ncbi:putative Hydroxyphenylpyruvate reductase, partial [Cocos nucifera]
LAANFRLLKPWESPLPRDAFLATQSTPALCGPSSAPASPGPVDARLLAGLPQLELVVNCSVGLNRIDVAERRHRGIAISIAWNAFTEDSRNVRLAS